MIDEGGPYTHASPEEGRLAALVERRFGVLMRPRHVAKVCDTLRSRVQAQGGTSLMAYLDRLDAGGAEDDDLHLISQVTTNVTAFFRESHHFDSLRAHVAQLPADRAVRCWSAGCSTGEEAWSVLSAIAPLIEPRMRRLMLVLGTDINRSALARARAAFYPIEVLNNIPAPCRTQFIAGTTTLEPQPDLRPLMRIRTLNLIEAFPFEARFDAIFCRNTLIYFSPEQRYDIVCRLTERMHHGALLMLGHSETLHALPDGLEPAGRTTYRRVA